MLLFNTIGLQMLFARCRPNVGSVVEWLERRDCDGYDLGFKTYSRHSVVSSEKTLYGTFPCLMVLASSSKFQSYFYETWHLRKQLRVIA